jgi:hypothetical protein
MTTSENGQREAALQADLFLAAKPSPFYFSGTAQVLFLKDGPPLVASLLSV